MEKLQYRHCNFFFIYMEQELSIWKKLYLLYNFFFVRKVIAHVVTFYLYCVLVPVSVMVPEVNIPVWGVVYIPTAITLLNAIRNPRFDTLTLTLSLQINFLCISNSSFLFGLLITIIHAFISSYTISDCLGFNSLAWLTQVHPSSALMGSV